MAPYALNTIGYEHPYARSEAPSDSVSCEIEFEAQQERPQIQPGQITYALVQLIYNWLALDQRCHPVRNNPTASRASRCSRRSASTRSNALRRAAKPTS